MGSSLDALAEEAANKATCSRCGVVILADSSAEGVVFGRIMVPLVRVNHAFQMCGKCGLALREFVFPPLLQDRNYLAVKEQLLTRFWL